jgi:regulator of protease activity HflC (stomatin/prohibitin superfamily)
VKAQNIALGAAAVVVFVLTCGVLFGSCAGYKAFERSQRRADANNNVRVTQINIRKAQQQALIVRAQNAAVRARAEQRFLEAVGIRKAQDEISKTLTPLYVQHEAIQAQERTASSGQNNTVVYVPSGPNGVPLVNDINQVRAK